jgi:hypothetical protein
MSKLSKFVDKIGESKETPFSFSFHCQVGKILDDNDSNINTTKVNEKVIAPSELIPFMP